MNTNVKDYVEPMKSQMAQKMEDMQNRVSDTARSVSDAACNASKATDRYVRENPWMTIGAVAVAACLLGWLLRSSKD
jgi:ElaB/YqjD/DUF883 family membrane-anchored ribosome-binding protein